MRMNLCMFQLIVAVNFHIPTVVLNLLFSERVEWFHTQFASSSTDCSGATMSHHQWWCLTRSYCLQLYNSAGWSAWWPFCQASVGQTVLLHLSAVHSVIAKILKDNAPHTAVWYAEQQLCFMDTLPVQLKHSVDVNDKHVWRWETATSVLVHDTHLQLQHHFHTCWTDNLSVPYSHNVGGSSQIPFP